MTHKPLEQIRQPITLFLIGATGDLARKKIFNALYRLWVDGVFAHGLTLIANSRSERSDQEFRSYVDEIISQNDFDTPSARSAFLKTIFYVAGDAAQKSTHQAMEQAHQRLADQHSCVNHVWFLATLPELYVPVVQQLKETPIESCGGWTKILLEKPFGTNLETAHELNAVLLDLFDENDIYRIDHFLQKETIQNILTFRFANGVFENLWSKENVDHIQIKMLETDGVAHRADFYDATGATKDVVQNHMLQMLATTLLPEPQKLTSEEVRAARSRILESLRVYTPQEAKQNIVFGQYNNYQETVKEGSTTETAVALRCFVDTPQWQDVPIYIKTAKKAAEDVTEISIVFKEPQNALFTDESVAQQGNILTFRIKPDQAIILQTKIRKPGYKSKVEMVPWQFHYSNVYPELSVGAYAMMVYDVIHGNQMFFTHARGIEAAWAFIDPVVDYRKSLDIADIDSYAEGESGLASFDELIEQDGRHWQ